MDFVQWEDITTIQQFIHENHYEFMDFIHEELFINDNCFEFLCQIYDEYRETYGNNVPIPEMINVDLFIDQFQENYAPIYDDLMNETYDFMCVGVFELVLTRIRETLFRELKTFYQLIIGDVLFPPMMT